MMRSQSLSILHENRLLADDSREISYLVFLFENKERCHNFLSSAAAVIGSFND